MPANMPHHPYFTTLPSRGLIMVEGDEARSFLQGLITNDINSLKEGIILYSCLLTPQGKFLHDAFIHQGPQNSIWLDCEGGTRAQDLYNRLLKYRLRQNVKISIEENHPVYAIIGESALGLPDPRHKQLGTRSFEKPQNLPEQEFETWDRLRISLCIPDGSRDLTPEKSTLAEANMDKLNAINYEKGCYVGQELTARMHYRSLGKKHLQCINPQDHPNAEIRSGYADIALALIRS